MNTRIPEGYKSILSVYDTQKAIGLMKRLFEDNFAGALNLMRVSAPLFVDGGRTADSPALSELSGQLEQDGGAAHGTGLKLVAQIAAAHGGKVQFKQTLSGRLCVSIVLPFVPAETGGFSA